MFIVQLTPDKGGRTVTTQCDTEAGALDLARDAAVTGFTAVVYKPVYEVKVDAPQPSVVELP